MKSKQLECRIVLTRGRVDLKTELGMYCPVTSRYEPLGAHGPDQRVLDRVVGDLRDRLEREGHLVTYSDVRNR